MTSLARLSPAVFRRLLNLWPPFLFSGIVVRRVAPDFHEIEACLCSRLWNRNPRGTHFGGSLYAMTDPFYALMLARLLGPDYVVWDRRASIDFQRPGVGSVCARFTLDPTTVDEIRAAAATGEKVLRDFLVEIVDAGGLVVATVDKTVYIRKRRPQI